MIPYMSVIGAIEDCRLQLPFSSTMATKAIDECSTNFETSKSSEVGDTPP